MDVVIAGIASGLLFASILISVGCFVIFQMYRNNVIWVVDLFKDTTASKVIYPIIIFLNPTMAIFGVIFGFIFIIYKLVSREFLFLFYSRILYLYLTEVNFLIYLSFFY